MTNTAFVSWINLLPVTILIVISEILLLGDIQHKTLLQSYTLLGTVVLVAITSKVSGSPIIAVIIGVVIYGACLWIGV